MTGEAAPRGPAGHDLEHTFRERWYGSVLDLSSPVRQPYDRAHTCGPGQWARSSHQVRVTTLTCTSLPPCRATRTTTARSPGCPACWLAATCCGPAPPRAATGSPPCDLENRQGTPAYVHAKVVAVDDVWAMIGSDNLNRRSWSHDGELPIGVLESERDPRNPHDPASGAGFSSCCARW